MTDEELVSLARALYLPRLVEEKMLRLLRQGRLSKWFSGIGQEAIAVGVASALRPADFILPLHRNLGVFTTRGFDLDRVLRQVLGRDGGFTAGRDRSFHFGALEHAVVGMISHLGAMLPVADGLALAGHLRATRPWPPRPGEGSARPDNLRVVAVFSGDGGTSEGDFHEAANLAAVWRLPVLFVVENNGWGLSTPTHEQYACEHLADRGAGYGMPGVVVDGNDVLAVMAAVGEAAQRARCGGGPTLLEFLTYRMRGHEEASGTDYVLPEALEEWARRDPLVRFEAVLDERGVLPEPERAALRAEIAADVDARVEAALAAPGPSSTAEAELAGVWAPAPARPSRPPPGEPSRPPPGEPSRPSPGEPSRSSPGEPSGSSPGEPSRSSPGEPSGSSPGEPSGSSPGEPSGSSPGEPSGPSPGEPSRPSPAEAAERRYLDAISDGLREAMRADAGVILLGQDIAEYGGAFKVTAGFVEEFGKERVRNTPIVESAALGCALGLALDGFHPMVEMQFADFIACGFNQIVNNLATTHYRWGAPVPVVIRAPVGGGIAAGPFHSQNVEGYFANVPGLKIVAPATPADAKGLLLAAFEDANPVLYLEHKALYRSARGPVPAGWYTVPIGEARLARPGRDATVVTWGVGLTWALEAAGVLAADDGAEVEVIDLRSLRPWDEAAVLASVERTGRVLVLHEAPVTGGFGAEVAAVIAERGFAHLDAPVARLGSLDVPIPFKLEDITSAKGRVLPTLRRLLAY